MQGMYSMRSPAVKRLMKEAQELREATEQYECHPLEDNLFEWHFTIRGPADSEFDGGFYHGRIILPPDYPMKPPSIIILTPNGRFETNKKICLSISGHHPESWQPSWSLRTALLAIIGFMPTHGAGALGSLDYTPEERKVLSRRSRDFRCSECGRIDNILKPVTEESEKTKREAEELASQISFKNEKEKKDALKEVGISQDTTDGDGSTTTTTTTEGATLAAPQQQTSPLPQFPFGQPPFPFQPPFMPPFPPGSTQQQAGSNPAAQVPRFPLPFVGPMMPPFYPPVMNPANFPVPPTMMPGMGVPPWQQQNAAMAPPTSPSNTNSRDTTPSTETVASSREATQATESTPSATNGPQNSDNAQGSEQSEETRTVTQSAATSASGVADASNASATPLADVAGASEGLRQRTSQQSTGQRSSQPIATQPPVAQSRTREPQSPAFIVFAAVIICLIALLLFRRIYSMKYFSLMF